MRVEARNLVKNYATVFALNGVSINVRPGEMMVLLGPSGCGKTTLLRSIAGLVEPQGGDILLDGRPVYSAEKKLWVPPERRGISMVFQSYALWPHMTLFDNIAYPLTCKKMPVADIKRRVGQVMEAVGLSGLADRLPSQLSGGQQQRAALGRAIASHSAVVLFDEPLSNVDAKVRDQIRHEIVDLQKQMGFAALYVTHDQAEAGALADTLVVMDQGRIAQAGHPSEIYDNPATRFVANFVGSANEMRGRLTERQPGGMAVAETALGPIVGRLRSDDVTAGDICVMFRPEACRLSTQEPSGPNRWKCKVYRSTFMASMAEIILTVESAKDGRQMTALLPRGSWREGAEVWLQLAPESVWMFAG